MLSTSINPTLNKLNINFKNQELTLFAIFLFLEENIDRSK